MNVILSILREQYTLQLLNKFKTKLETVRTTNIEHNLDDDDFNDDQWLSHTLRFEDQGEVLAKDASTKKDDWYDVYDPRNSLNKRKRGEERHRGKDHKHGTSSRDRK